MRKLSVIILVLGLALVLALFPVSSSRADCTWIFHLDTDPELVCTPTDLYYTELTSVPDWCAYQQGDHVFLKFDHTLTNPPIDAYYFIPASADLNTSPPAGFDPWPFYIVHNQLQGCWYTFF